MFGDLASLRIVWKLRRLKLNNMINMIKVAKPFSLLLLGVVFLGCGESEKEKSASVIDEAIRMELDGCSP